MLKRHKNLLCIPFRRTIDFLLHFSELSDTVSVLVFHIPETSVSLDSSDSPETLKMEAQSVVPCRCKKATVSDVRQVSLVPMSSRWAKYSRTVGVEARKTTEGSPNHTTVQRATTTQCPTACCPYCEREGKQYNGACVGEGEH